MNSTEPSVLTMETQVAESVKEKSDVDDPSFLVEFASEDKRNPKNWSRGYRWYLTVATGILVLNATFASSAPSGSTSQIIQEFHLSNIVATLQISLFVAGYCVGPIIWGPLSEQIGRRPVFIISFTVYTAFQLAMALAKNTASLLIFRFIGGTFAAAPLTNTGALLADVWDVKTRGKALALFTVMPYAGPALGPTVAGFLNVAGVSWRWLYWLLTIFAGVCLLLIIFTVPETYAPVILAKIAQQKRKETGDSRYYAPLERQKQGFVNQLERVVAKPFKMLFLEPMLFVTTIYMSFVYGALYLLFVAYPIVFTQQRGFNPGISGLMFLPIPVGGIIAVTIYVLYFNPAYEREADRLSPEPVPPEFRLWPCLYGAPIYALSFFWFGWTSYPSISYWAPMMAGLPMAIGINWIFLGLFNYLIDTYTSTAASALASSTVVRSLFGAVFPLFARQMYTALNPRWATTVLGLFAVVMIPIPFVFKRYGATLRRKSRYSPQK